jgi:hypothetical protein
MTRLKFIQSLALAVLCAPLLGQAADRVVVIGNANVRKMDLATVQRIFMGKTIEVDGVRVSPTNGAATMPARQRFLAQYLQTDEDQYVAYWTVRRYVGKGTPPHEVRQTAEMIDFINKTPGAVGYLDEADLQPGMNVVLRK